MKLGYRENEYNVILVIYMYVNLVMYVYVNHVNVVTCIYRQFCDEN